MENRKNRIKLIKTIQKLRGSKVITYVTGDRANMAAQINSDAIRPLYSHLLELKGPVKKIDLFLYSRGGDVGTPWPLISMLREFTEEVNVLIPFRAHSAATMIAIGCDNIVMGRKAELSPIDPSLVSAESTGLVSQINVEDAFAYKEFIQEHAKLTEQNAVAQLLGILAQNIQPLTLGKLTRLYSHIRLVAKKLLDSRNNKTDKTAEITKALVEKMYSHGHAINRKEAKELGLPVEIPDAKLEAFMWALYNEYEALMHFTEPFDIEAIFANRTEDEHIAENVRIACIESEKALYVFEQTIRLTRKRNIPPNLQLNLNLNLNLPANIDPNTLPQNIQNMLQQIQQQILNALPGMVRQEIARQALVVGIEGRAYGGRWKRAEQ